MSSNIEVQRVCESCGNIFKARTTTTRFCSHKCNSKYNKAKVKSLKIDLSNKETHRIISKPIEELKAKEFLTVRDVANLLNCSIRTVYYYIENGNIKAVNLGQRITRVKRSELDKLFEQSKQEAPQFGNKHQTVQYNISDCYNLTEVLSNYGISEKALHDLIKRNNIPKIKKGRFAYVPKVVIDKILIPPKTLFD
jgi:excisionase family DNA binding protein